MPKGIKGFQKGHTTSKKTREKIGLALRGKWIKYNCDYCGKENEEKQSHYNKKKRHFCNMKCYAMYRKEIMPKEEHNRYGTGEPIGVQITKLKCRNNFNHYLRDKKVERKPCVICGNKKSEGHHFDYTKPFEVTWLCFEHHRQLHRDKVIQKDFPIWELAVKTVEYESSELLNG